MNSQFIELIKQTYNFPQEEFSVVGNELVFNGVNMMNVIKEYGTPLKFTYLPKISDNINKAKQWFIQAMNIHQYDASYYYCYCTKSAHFAFVMNEVLANDVHIETSSAIDINIVNKLKTKGKISDNTFVICNGYKCTQYIENIAQLINEGHHNCLPIIDNEEELVSLSSSIDRRFAIGVRIATEEDAKFDFYTSRLGIGYKDIIPFYNYQVNDNKNVELRMLHFFVSSGISDSAYYWNELAKCLDIYVQLKKKCKTLNCLNIGGGFPIKDSLSNGFEYSSLVSDIIYQIKKVCSKAKVPVPHIFTEFGNFTVGESGGTIYQVLHQKQQNDREKWNIIDSSFITTLPDTWAIKKRFVMLPINRWNDEYERVLLGGLTCDSDDYYNSEQHKDQIYLPKYYKDNPLYIGYFHTGAYQEAIGGFGGVQHCLIPHPKHVIIDRDQSGNISTKLFSKEQTSSDMLEMLGY